MMRAKLRESEVPTKSLDALFDEEGDEENLAPSVANVHPQAPSAAPCEAPSDAPPSPTAFFDDSKEVEEEEEEVVEVKAEPPSPSLPAPSPPPPVASSLAALDDSIEEQRKQLERDREKLLLRRASRASAPASTIAAKLPSSKYSSSDLLGQIIGSPPADAAPTPIIPASAPTSPVTGEPKIGGLRWLGGALGSGRRISGGSLGWARITVGEPQRARVLPTVPPSPYAQKPEGDDEVD